MGSESGPAWFGRSGHNGIYFTIGLGRKCLAKQQLQLQQQSLLVETYLICVHPGGLPL